MSKLGFVALLGCFAAIVYCLPIDSKLTPLIIAARTSQARYSITGNSVLTHFSKCDADPRSIAHMLTAEMGQPVLDLSFPGQSLSESVNLAAVSLRDPDIRAVVVPLSVFALLEWDAVPIRAYLAFRLLNPSIAAESLRHRMASPDWFSHDMTPLMRPYVYDGVQYPDYGELKRRYMRAEQASMGCPENDGHDMAFVTSLYHHEYIELPLVDQNFTLLASLGQEAKRLGKTLHVVLLPIDYELMERLLPADVARMRERVAAVQDGLMRAGLSFTDLTASSPNAHFADRWCACGHLGADGRLLVATQTGRALIERLPPMAAQR